MISLVFPAYNPGSLAERTWDSTREFLSRRSDPWEAIFVCDGCTDGTPEKLIARLHADPDPRFRVLHYAANQGKGHAVRAGMLAARGDFRIFTDIDLAYGFADVVRISDTLRSGAQVAIASREHPESIVQLAPRHLGYAYRRRLQSHVFGAIARMLLPLKQYDTQAGLKGMTAQVATQLLPRTRCNGFGFDCEFLTACARADIPVVEVPIVVKYEDAATTTGAGSVLRMIRELLRIRKTWPKGKPWPEPEFSTLHIHSVESAETPATSQIRAA